MLSSIRIVSPNSTGASTTNVMSQKAVTDALQNAVNLNTIYPVGIVVWFAQNKNPTTLFPGNSNGNTSAKIKLFDSLLKWCESASTNGGSDLVTIGKTISLLHH
ncbi:hypothetical protein [Providencia huaxiensis]|uniref:hypothetical protein n=1 Tax=Providencia huaxiensis TaxID=2027290 RepID=UPI0034DD0446